MKLKDIATAIDGRLSGNGETDISYVAAITEAQDGDVTFLLNRSFERYLSACRASALIVGADIDQALLAGKNTIVVANPALAQIKVAEPSKRRSVRKRA